MHIFVDWGSTNFRAFLMNGKAVIDRRHASGRGILQSFSKVPASERRDYYALFLKNQLDEWLAKKQNAEIIMCGAVGSREGWVDTGYVEAPASFSTLARSLRRLLPEEGSYMEDRTVSILPGLAVARDNGRHDIMRSEEIKSLGAMAHLGQKDGILCVPGTHCKWVRVDHGQITDFHSLPTGELYGILGESGSLAPLFAPDSADNFDYASFDQGFALAQTGHDLLSDLWQVRAQKIRSASPPEDPRSYFSGILMGHELKYIKSLYGDLNNLVLLCDSGSRQQLYQRAFEQYNWSVTHAVESETAVCTGLSALIDQ